MNIKFFVYATILCIFIASTTVLGQDRGSRMTQRISAGQIPTIYGVTIGIIGLEDDNATTTGGGLFIDFEVEEHIGIGINLDYWRADFNKNSITRSEVADTVLSTNAKYVFRPKEKSIRPYVGIGLGGHRLMVKEKTKFFGERTALTGDVLIQNSNTLNQLGGDLLAGIYFRVEDKITGVLQYMLRALPYETDYNHMGLSAGASYQF